MTDTSNTGTKQDNKGRFTKGDPRINRKGRPKSFDALRQLAQTLAHEIARGKNGQPIEVEGHIATSAEMILREMMRDAKQRKEFLEIAFGKVPQPVALTGAEGEPLKIVVEYANSQDNPAPITPSPTED